MAHKHDWLMPFPFWGANGYRQAEFFRPALFEFNSDEFMEEFLAAAAAPMPTSLVNARLEPSQDGSPNKLFHPAHGCFYLAAASLCCREPGFPDRQPRRADGESVAFVLRKLVEDHEYGWVVDANDNLPPGEKGWLPLNGTGRTLLEGEDRLPTFAIPTTGGRQLLCCYVPTSSGDTYNVKPSLLAVGGEDGPAIQELGSRFIAPLYADPGTGARQIDDLPDGPTDDPPLPIAQTTSVYLLVELLEFLREYVSPVAEALQPGAASPSFSGESGQARTDLLAFLEGQAYKGCLSLADALRSVAAEYDKLDAPGGGNLDALGFTREAYSLKSSHDLDNDALDGLRDAVANALPAEPKSVAVPKLQVSASIRYVLRFVYERPQCDPAQIEVSLPSQPFTFAPFFDTDAPARPVRIPLPSDVSIAGLRKASKNVSFMMSDAMRRKMNMLLGKEESLLSDDPKTNPEDGLDFAFICSFSIPIIFIVAFMLLLIFVVVFNIIFWWLPFFKICFPVPKALLPE